jgi:hypothetical protein
MGNRARAAAAGDELNTPEAGKNYGWPVIVHGIDYPGDTIGEGITEHAGMEQPHYYWDPVIAPSGLAFYTGNLFPQWVGGRGPNTAIKKGQRIPEGHFHLIEMKEVQSKSFQNALKSALGAGVGRKSPTPNIGPEVQPFDRSW